MNHIWSRLTSAFNVPLFAILILVPMEPNIRYQDISIMRNKIFNHLGRTVLYIHVPPVNPRVLRFQCNRKKIIPCSSQCLPSRSLCRKAVSVFYVLAKLDSKVFLDDQSASKWNVVRSPLYSVQFRG